MVGGAERDGGGGVGLDGERKLGEGGGGREPRFRGLLCFLFVVFAFFATKYFFLATEGFWTESGGVGGGEREKGREPDFELRFFLGGRGSRMV